MLDAAHEARKPGKRFAIIAGLAFGAGSAASAVLTFAEGDNLILDLSLSGAFGLFTYLTVSGISALRHSHRAQAGIAGLVRQPKRAEQIIRRGTTASDMTIAQQKLLPQLETIATMKNLMPADRRLWCNRLGLYVQHAEVGGQEILQASSESQAYFRARRPGRGQSWRIEKYTQGEWEQLIGPTRDLTTWIAVQGVTPENQAGFDEAIANFKRTGKLNLP